MELSQLAAKPQLIELTLDNSAEINERKDLIQTDLDLKLKSKDLSQEEYDTEVQKLSEMKSIVDEYGEALTFWTYDRVNLDTFMKLANADENEAGDMIDIVRTLLLDKNGRQVINKNVMLPTKVLTLAIAEIVSKLSKF